MGIRADTVECRQPGHRILLELVERIDDRIDDCGERQGGEIPLNPSTDAMKFDLVEEC